jgi:hypothetical protein
MAVLIGVLDSLHELLIDALTLTWCPLFPRVIATDFTSRTMYIMQGSGRNLYHSVSGSHLKKRARHPYTYRISAYFVPCFTVGARLIPSLPGSCDHLVMVA